MSLVDEVRGGRACRICALGWIQRKPGILGALDFEFVAGEAGRSVFAGTPEEPADESL
jgi:hypothetical protein